MSDRVLLEVENAVAHVILNRPDKHNGIDLGLATGLVDAGKKIRRDASIRAVVLSGRGESFCAGLDVKSFMSNPNAGPVLLHRPDDSPANLAQRCAWIWQEVNVPVIAALHGAVYGGGLQIALGADLRFVHPNSRLSVMEIKWGLIPDMAASQTLLKLVRPDVARDLTFTGRIVSGKEAVSLGLATRMCAQPLAEARAVAAAITDRNPHAIRAIKRLYTHAPDLSVADAFELETELQMTVLGSPNQLEAVHANLEDRKPEFSDPE